MSIRLRKSFISNLLKDSIHLTAGITLGENILWIMVSNFVLSKWASEQAWTQA